MSNDAMITLQGWLGGAASLREASGVPVASFRIGCTPRRFHRARQEWIDEETQWYTVTAWRALAENCARSLHKGDPIVVHGRLSHRTYQNKDGIDVVSLEIDAVAVGHDLNRGSTFFTKLARPERPEWAAQGGETAADQGAETTAGSGRADGFETPPEAGVTSAA